MSENKLSSKNTELKITKTKKIFNKVGKLYENDGYDGKSYIIRFNSMDDITDFYNKIIGICYKTNFGCNPFEWASFGYFKYRGIDYVISPPKQKNGDDNWYSYSRESKRYAFIRIVNDEINNNK